MSVLPALAIGSTLLGGVMGAAGAAKSSSAQYQAAMFQSEIAKQNSQIADSNANAVIAQGQAVRQQQQVQSSQLQGTERANAAALGQMLNIQGSSAQNIQQGTARQGSSNADTITYNSQRQALGMQLQANQLTQQSQLDTMQASSALTAGDFGVATSLIGSLGKSALMQYNFNKLGTGGS